MDIRRLAASAAVCLFSLAALLSCGESAAETPASGSASADTAAEETAAETTTALSAASVLPSADYGGRTFMILGREYAKLGDLPSYEFTVESETGDLINDVIFQRNMAVEERYNVKIASSQGDASSLIPKSVMSGDDAYQLAWAHVSTMSGLVLKGSLADYYTVPNIDITQPWWNQLATDSLTVNGRCYLQMNYIPFTGVLLSHCLYYDQKLATDYGVSDLYGMVNGGTWTFDRFDTEARKVSADLNGDGVYDASDLYGIIASHGTSAVAMGVAMGVVPVDVHDDGSFTLTMGGEKNQKILEMVNTLMHSDCAYLITDYSKENDIAKMFAAGQGLFYSGFLTDSYQFFRDKTDDYGLLPFPKYDEAQEKYITTVTGGTGLLGVPLGQSDFAFTGMITEALAIESLSRVYPAVYETVVEEKLLRDEDSKKMFDILMDGMAIDFGRTFKDAAYSDLLGDLCVKNSNDLASAEAKAAKSAEKQYRKVLDVFYGE